MQDYLMGYKIWSMGGRSFQPSLDDVKAAIVRLPSVLKAPSPSKMQQKVPNKGSEESA